MLFWVQQAGPVWGREGERLGAEGGRGGVRHSCHLPGAGGLEGKRLLTTPGERTPKQTVIGRFPRGDTWGQGLLQASLRMNQDREAVKGEIADALA